MRQKKGLSTLGIVGIIFGSLIFISILVILFSGSSSTSKPAVSTVSTPSVSTGNSGSDSGNSNNNVYSWHTVKSFSGTSDKTTDTFKIQGKKYRLTYTVNPANEYSAFYLSVYEEGNSFAAKMLSLDSGTESSIIYGGPGTFYLDVGAANLDGWNVKIEDYY